mgnify:CR=1 FL=1
MSNTHTPGPWIVADIHPERACLSVAPEGKNPLCEDVATVYASNENADADARLIAAAPELLEALMFIVEQVSNEKNSHHTLGAFSRGVGIDMAKKAITKVKGE